MRGFCSYGRSPFVPLRPDVCPSLRIGLGTGVYSEPKGFEPRFLRTSLSALSHNAIRSSMHRQGCLPHIPVNRRMPPVTFDLVPIGCAYGTVVSLGLPAAFSKLIDGITHYPSLCHHHPAYLGNSNRCQSHRPLASPALSSLFRYWHSLALFGNAIGTGFEPVISGVTIQCSARLS